MANHSGEARIAARFAALKAEKRAGLVAFVTAGDPDLDTTLALRKPEFQVAIDREKASDLGIPVATIADSLRVLVGGGGTAGHIYPALSVLHELAERARAAGHQAALVHFAHGPSRIDAEVLAHAGIARTRLAASPVRGVAPHRAV